MRLLGKNKENSIENLSNGPGTEVGTRMFTNKYLIRLLWPLFVEQLLVFAIGIADSFMVASVGEEAVSAVSLVDSIMMLLITIMTALATGGAVVVGQFLGQKKEAEARKAGDQLLLFVTALSLIIVAVMYIFRKGLLPLVFGDVEPQVMAYCDTYYKIVVATVPLIAVYNAGAALFRSIGNSKIAMKISLLMNVINISGNAVLLYGFHCGVEGVAIPTLVRCSADCYQSTAKSGSGSSSQQAFCLASKLEADQKYLTDRYPKRDRKQHVPAGETAASQHDIWIWNNGDRSQCGGKYCCDDRSSTWHGCRIRHCFRYQPVRGQRRL